MPTSQTSTPTGDLIGEDPTKADVVMSKEQEVAATKRQEENRKELEEIIDKRIRSYDSALANTFKEIMDGEDTSEKNEGDN